MDEDDDDLESVSDDDTGEDARENDREWRAPMNPFFDVESHGEEPFSPRLYARVAEVEERSEEGSSIFFDAIDAEDFDQDARPGSRAWLQTARLRILEMRVDQLAIPLDEPEDPTWYEIFLTRAQSGFRTEMLRVYESLFALEPRSAEIGYIRAVPPEVRRRLARAFRLSRSWFATAIRRRLGKVPRADAAAVYDVGQGSCAAAITADHPSLYIDFGGGVLGNAWTFPQQLQRWCFSDRPSVLLTHWDWDHWSSAARDRRALDCDWIVPQQELGPVHVAFAQSIRGRLCVWPGWLRSIETPSVRVERCTGRGRNHSGLAVILKGPNAHDRMLFPGDARYTAVPSACGGSTAFSAIAVPHHGADMRTRHVPSPHVSPFTRMAYSYGERNTFGHPRLVTQQRHDGSGWLHEHLSAAPGHGVDRSTAHRPRYDRPGHIALSWERSTRPHQCVACHGTACDLMPEQS